MFYYLIKNLLNNSKCNYKGLDLNKIIGNAQVYPKNLNLDNRCLIVTSEDVQENIELIKITEEEYLNIKKEIDETKQNIETEQAKLLREKQEVENQLLIEKDKNIGGIL